jgi:hypothetical protein
MIAPKARFSARSSAREDSPGGAQPWKPLRRPPTSMPTAVIG